MVATQEQDKMQWKTKVNNTEKELASSDRADLSTRGGPLCSTLDTILDNYNITPQSYHSRSFIGNHCHRYYTQEVYKKLTTHIVKITMECTNNLTTQKNAIALKHRPRCCRHHQTYNHKYHPNERKQTSRIETGTLTLAAVL